MVYVFIIVSIAVLLYGLNAYAYPKRQFIYDDVNLQVRCAYHPELVDTEKCRQVSTAVKGMEAPPQLEPAIEKNLWFHQLQLSRSFLAMPTARASEARAPRPH